MATSNSLLECPICLEIPESEVYQCEEGHAVCARCYSKISNCPQCKVSYGMKKIRCRPIEAILDSMKFPCVNEKRGCKQVVPRQEVKGHSKICTFRPVATELCKLLGYNNCDYIVKGDDATVMDNQHFRSKHGALELQESGIELQLQLSSETASSPSSDMIGTPVLLKVNKWTILVVACLNKQNKAMSFRAVSLFCSNKKSLSESEYEVDFHIKSDSDQVKDIKWTTPVVDLKSAHLRINCESFQISMEFLKAHFLHDKKHLVANVRVKEITKDPSKNIKGSLRVAAVLMSPTTTQESRKTVVFSDVTCDECETNDISEVRYKCLQCADFDLCGPCMRAKKHVQHVFAMITNQVQEQYIHRITTNPNSSSGWKTILPEKSSGLRRESTTAFRAGCDGCGDFPIVGIRYTCLFCGHVDLCGNCIKLGIHPHHIFGIILNSSQEDFIDGLQLSRTSIISTVDSRWSAMIDLREHAEL